jgi:hypothetical protein
VIYLDAPGSDEDRQPVGRIGSSYWAGAGATAPAPRARRSLQPLRRIPMLHFLGISVRYSNSRCHSRGLSVMCVSDSAIPTCTQEAFAAPHFIFAGSA